MSAKNDITGDSIATRAPSDAYRDGWDRIFGKKIGNESEQSVGKSAEVQTERNAPLRTLKWLDF